MQVWLDRGANISYDISWEPHKLIFMRAEEARRDEDLFSMLSAPEEERCPFDIPSSCCFSVPELMARRGDVISFSDFWSFGADDRQVAAISAALRGDLEMFKDICDSDDCSVFNRSGVGVEDSNLSDLFKYWTLHEYAELAFLRASRDSIRHPNLHPV